jgi:hypothetical protein
VEITSKKKAKGSSLKEPDLQKDKIKTLDIIGGFLFSPYGHSTAISMLPLLYRSDYRYPPGQSRVYIFCIERR